LEEARVVYGPEVYAATGARGKAEAEKDIKAGHFRVRDWENRDPQIIHAFALHHVSWFVRVV
jgi:hypothetical protein